MVFSYDLVSSFEILLFLFLLLLKCGSDSTTFMPWQHRHMIKTSSVSIQMRDFVMDLRKC
jgi:cell division protein FtsL